MLAARKYLKCLLVLSMLMTIVSCATNKVSDLYEFYEIESEGQSKLFGYGFILDPTKRQAGKSLKNVPKGFAVSFADMRKELEKHMKIHPYCLEGFFVYDEVFDGKEYKLLGECQESK